jgi:serine/threonine protein kinase/WD40 repeat protein
VTSTYIPEKSMPIVPSAKTAHPLPSDPEPGEVPVQIGRYHILLPIGSGDRARVYLGRQDRPFLRLAAVKLLMVRVTEESRDALLYEAEVLANLCHPRIVRFYEAGYWFDRPFVVMERVEGTPLLSYCLKRHPSLRQRMEIFVQICDAAHYIHERSYLHRDLSPNNVLVIDPSSEPASNGQDDGEAATPTVKVIDFSLAVTLKSEECAQGGVGTAGYISPEQAAGGPGIDCRSDIYSLGAMLHSLLTGEPPSEPPVEAQARGGSALPSVVYATSGARLEEVARSCCMDGLRLLKAFRKLDTIVQKALAIELDERYSTAAELAAAVRRFVAEDLPDLEGDDRIRTIRRLAGLGGKLGVVLAIAAVGLIALAASSAYFYSRSRYLNQELNRFTQDLKGIQEKLTYAEGKMKEQKQDALKYELRSYAGQVRSIPELLSKSGVASARRELLSCGKALRRWEWSYLNQCSDNSVRRMGRSLQGFVRAVPMACEDAPMIAGGAIDGSVWGWDESTGEFRFSSDLHDSPVVDLVLCAGKNVALSMALDGSLCLWSARTGKLIRQTAVPLPSVALASLNTSDLLRLPRFSPRGEFLFWLGDGEPKIIPLKVGDRSVVLGDAVKLARTADMLAPKQGDVVWAAWAMSRAGLRLVTVRRQSVSQGAVQGARHSHVGELALWDAATGRCEGYTKNFPALDECTALAATEHRLVVGLDDEAYLFNLDTAFSGQRTGYWSLNGHSGRVFGVALSDDSKLVATSGQNDNTIRLWNAADGRLLGAGDDIIAERGELRGHHGIIASIEFVPGDRFLVSASFDGMVYFWNRSGRRDVTELRPPDEQLDQKRKNAMAHVVTNVRYGGDASAPVLVAATMLPALNAWDGQGEFLGDCQPNLAGGTRWDEIDALGVSRDGSTAVAAVRAGGAVDGSRPPDHKLLVWRIKTKDTALLELSPDAGGGGAVAVSTDASWLASVAVYPSRPIVQLWRRIPDQNQAYQPAGDLSGCKGEVQGLDFSPDGRLVAAACADGRLLVWDVAKSATVQDVTFSGHTLQCLRFASDSNRIAVGTGAGDVFVYDLAAEKALDPDPDETGVAHNGKVYSVAFSPNGSRLLSCSDDRSVMIWDSEARTRLLAIQTRSFLPGADWSPDGMTVAVAGGQQAVVLFHAAPWNDPETDARLLVDRLFARHTWSLLVEQRVAAETDVLPAVRELALKQVKAISDDPEALAAAAWEYVYRTDKAKVLQKSGTDDRRQVEPSRTAELIARRAKEMRDGKPQYLAVYGAVLYRAGKLQESKDLLQRATAVSPVATGQVITPADQNRARGRLRARILLTMVDIETANMGSRFRLEQALNELSRTNQEGARDSMADDLIGEARSLLSSKMPRN